MLDKLESIIPILNKKGTITIEGIYNEKILYSEIYNNRDNARSGIYLHDMTNSTTIKECTVDGYRHGKAKVAYNAMNYLNGA